MAFRPYLAFDGDCRQAFTRYQEIFGGELVILAPGDAPGGVEGMPEGTNPDGVMHAALSIGGEALMGADDLSGHFDGNVNGMCVTCSLPDAGETKRVFDALSEGGEVQMPLSETFFSPAFGMCRDRFGVPWMVMVEQAEPA